jgi:hypothetical protein
MSKSEGRLLPSIRNIVATIPFMLFAVAASAGPAQEACHGFLPKNNKRIPVQSGRFSTNAGGLSEAQFNGVIDTVEKLYTDEIAQAGGKLEVERLWQDETVNASASREHGAWLVSMYGGLARAPHMTTDGFTMVLCHELGHHMGGAPKVKGKMPWATNEGGADYFATLKCARRVFEKEDNKDVKNDTSIPALAKERCEKQFTAEADQLICMRSVRGALVLAKVMQGLQDETTEAKLDTPDTAKRTKMYDGHPATQCRLDTYFAAAACPVAVNVKQSDTDYREGSCVEGKDEFGWRSRCWFAPDDENKAPVKPKNEDDQFPFPRFY